MNVRRVGIMIIGGLTLLGSGIYVFVYLYRWEWNRALISGLIFLAAEVAVTGWIITARLRDIHEHLETNSGRQQAIAGHLRTARNEPSDAFAWLKSDGSSTNVFIPILMGAGLLLSALAWLVERIGRATAGASADTSVSAHLARLAPPPGGFLDDSEDPLRGLRAPAGAPR